MVTLKVNKQQFPFDLTTQQRERCLIMLDFYKRKKTFIGFIEHVDREDLQITYAFVGWFYIFINKASPNPAFPDIFTEIFKSTNKG
jgi:hypothetical protein